MLPIGLQLYSIRNEMQEDFIGTLKLVKSMGYEGVEFAGLHGHSAGEVKEILKEIGLIPVSAHVPYNDMISAPEEVFKSYLEIGCKYIAVPYLTPEYRMGGEKGEEAVDGIRSLGKTASQLGLTLLYHNHDFEFDRINGEYALDLLYSQVPGEFLQTEIDTCWVKVAGVDPSQYLGKYKGRSPVVHLKDFYMEGTDADGAYELIGIKGDGSKKNSSFEFRALGEGLQDFPSIIKAAEEAKAQWLIVELDEPAPGKTPLECVKSSIDFLHGEGRD